MKLTVNVDGGARGNPGPAAIGVVVRNADGGILTTVSERIGEATNNVAEYRALLAGIEQARALGADSLELFGDSELVVKQVRGEYKVKNAGIRPLHAEVLEALSDFGHWTIEHVRREQNAEADALVNDALDGRDASI
jgi:ribonuclease HI